MYSWAVATRRYSSLMRCVALRQQQNRLTVLVTAIWDHIPCCIRDHTKSPCRCHLPKLVL